jgi:hypothetical protein
MTRERNASSLRERLDLRAFEEAERDPRDIIVPLDVVRSNIPEQVIRDHPDKHFCLVNFWEGNKQLTKNYEQAVELGYEPFKRSEHPVLARAASLEMFMDKNDERNVYYITNDQILMWIPIETHKKHLAYLDSLNEKQMAIQKNHSGNEFGGGLRTLIDQRGVGQQIY